MRPSLTGRDSRPVLRTWLALAILLLGQFMALLDVTIVNVAVPAIGRDLRASGAELQLVVAGYTIAYAAGLITGARLGDLYGRRRMYLIGACGFTVMSLLCGLSPNIQVLVGARMIQGAAAAVMVPQIMSVIQLHFAGPARGAALGAYGAVLSLGGVAGMAVGGVLVDANLAGTGWRPVFLVNVPLGLVLVALVPRLVPADIGRATRRLDWRGLVLSTGTIVLLVVPLVLGHQVGWSSWTYASLAGSALLGWAFVIVERVVARTGGDPLFDSRVFYFRGVPAGIATLVCMQVAYGGFLFSFTVHLQTGLGDSALRTGVTYLPLVSAFGAVGFGWNKLPMRWQAYLVPSGMALCLLGYVSLGISLRDAGQDGPLFWSALVVLGGAMGACLSPLVAQTLTHVTAERNADASGLVTTTMQLGQVIGVAVIGSIYLSTADRFTPHHSAGAIATITGWLAALSGVGVVAALLLKRALAPPLAIASRGAAPALVTPAVPTQESS